MKEVKVGGLTLFIDHRISDGFGVVSPVTLNYIRKLQEFKDSMTIEGEDEENEDE